MKYPIKSIFTFIVFFTASAFAQSDLNSTRTKLIVDAFNAKPENLIRPLINSDVHLGQQDGRVDVNSQAKFSYYIHIESAASANSKMTLIPMATSRFTPTYYQTDEWWDAHKDEMAKAKAEGRPMPRQDMNEVQKWLAEMKLTTNPEVIVIDPATSSNKYIPLQEFLLEHYLKFYAKDGYITLFRGAEKAGEIDSWNRRETPRGVRYWTPTANYAWRYARKNTNFLDELMLDKTPLFKFSIPVENFKEMVQRRWQHLVLGTELTKNAHKLFDSSGAFQDHLNSGQAYMGEGHYGVEFELRSNRAGAQQMSQHYKGPVTIDDLVKDRVEVLERTMNRLIKKNPEGKEQLLQNYSNRINRVQTEGQLLIAIKENYSNEVVKKILSNLSGSAEFVNIDGVYLNSWVQNQLDRRNVEKIKTTPAESQLKELENRYMNVRPKLMCEMILR